METQLWIWRDIRLELPVDWELLLFSKRRDSGSITFADRYRYRLQLQWREPAGEPDMKRTVSDYASKIRKLHPEAEVRIAKRGAWHGVERSSFGETTARFLRYFGGDNLLVECVFPAFSQPSLPVDERQILAGVHPSDEVGRWIAFGMDLNVTGGMALEHCQVQPGLASLTFCDEERIPVRQRFSRRGMLGRWLSGSVEDWMELQVPAELEGARRHVEVHNGHEVRILTGSFQKRPSGGWRKLRQNYRAAAWICGEDGRLFHEEASGPGELPDVHSLSCCSRKGGRLHG